MELKAEGIARTFFRSAKSTNFFYAVEKTDFTLQEGKLTALVGRSGSGKTTFSNMLCGLLTPTEGHVLLAGEDLYAIPDEKCSQLRNRHFGIVPQGQSGLMSLTVLENVLSPVMMYGEAEPLKPRAMELLEELGIASLADVYAGELSGGEMRRMAIARALIRDPEIIIADEPTGDLDEEATDMVLRLLRAETEKGASVLMVTHDREAIPSADIVYRMDKGILTLEA